MTHLTLNFEHNLPPSEFEMIENINIYELNRNSLYESIATKRLYMSILNTTKGAYSINYDNNSENKFNAAIATLNPNAIQIVKLNCILSAFSAVEEIIDPIRLNFKISKASDEEICITRIAQLGISKLIVDEDGLITHSFVTFKSHGKDFLKFYDIENIDFELLAYKFLSL